MVKLSKSEVDYGPATGPDRCRACRNYLGPTCRVVEGPIDADAWCRRFLVNPLGALDSSGHAAGIIFVGPGGEVLLLRRAASEANYPGHWALPGGKGDEGETPEQTAVRETSEEIGTVPEGKRHLLESRRTPTGMTFHTFAVAVDECFEPKLNAEHDGHQWAALDALPSPLHPAVEENLSKLRPVLAGDGAAKRGEMQHAGNIALNMPTFLNDPATQGLDAEFGGWTTKQLEDALNATIRAWMNTKPKPGTAEPENIKNMREELRRRRTARDEALPLALDKDSVREFDSDGRMRVAVTNISKATINPYLGREIPNNDALGLDPNRRYRLFRHPDELKKGAPTFNGLPLLSEHVPITAETHKPEIVVGASGTDAEFVAPFLRNSLFVWPQKAIDDIEDEEKRELSCAYHYRADMTPGTWEGQPYDGVMRDIVGNHIALVRKGRAGPDVVVGDAALEEQTTTSNYQLSRGDIEAMAVLTRRATMTLGALVGYLSPRLAQDAAINFHPILADLTPKNFAERRPKIVLALKEATKGKLAKDANIDDVDKVLGAVESNSEAEPKQPEVDAQDDEPTKFLKGKMSAEDYAAYDGMRKAADEADEEKLAKEKAAKDAAGPPDFSGMPKVGGEPLVTKKAMDEAITGAVGAATDAARNASKAIRTAERHVRKWVGELALDHATADDVYKTALTSLGVKVEGVHPSAFPALLDAQPVPGARPAERVIAQDGKSYASFAERFPGAARIKSIG